MAGSSQNTQSSLGGSGAASQQERSRHPQAEASPSPRQFSHPSGTTQHMPTRPHAHREPPPQRGEATNGQGDPSPVRHYNLTQMSRARNIGQIATKRVDYRTQATPQPVLPSNGPAVGLVTGFLQDEYSDDDGSIPVVDDYDPHARAALTAYVYRRETSGDANASDDGQESSYNHPRASTPYDNDVVDDYDSRSSHHGNTLARDPGGQSGFSSPHSAISYATDPPHAPARSTSPLEARLASVERYRKAQRIVEAKAGGRQRARKGDYEPEAQEVIHGAAVIFKSLICSLDAYPNKLSEKTWAVDAWHAAAAKLDIKLAPTNDTLGLIAQYSWNLRGEIKNTARSLVQGAYGFKAGLTPPSRLYNQERCAFLRQGCTFAYEIIGEAERDHLGLYEAEIIQSIINRVFYKTATDDGVALAKVYEPFPFVGLALVLTAIQCSIDEWDTGAFVKVTFSEEGYYSVYRRHLQDLRAFEEESGADRILTEICSNISTRGR
ncbi:hypothetical protein ACG7TL_006737 [Trametes sanguinea]